MTPLDVRSPDGATLEQVLYAENKMFGDDNASHKLSDLDNDLKDGDYCDPVNDEADDDGSHSSAMDSHFFHVREGLTTQPQLSHHASAN